MIEQFYWQVINNIPETIVCGILLLIAGLISSNMSDKCYYAYYVGHSYDKEAAYFSILAITAYSIAAILFICLLAYAFKSRAEPCFNQISSDVKENIDEAYSLHSHYSSQSNDGGRTVYSNIKHSTSLAQYFDSR